MIFFAIYRLDIFKIDLQLSLIFDLKISLSRQNCLRFLNPTVNISMCISISVYLFININIYNAQTIHSRIFDMVRILNLLSIYYTILL